MKKRLLGLTAIICLFAVIFSLGAFNVGAKEEIQYEELVTVNFANATVGATAAAGSDVTDIKTGLTSKQNFTKIVSTGTKGASSIEIMEESGVKFARVSAKDSMTSGQYAIISFDPEDPTGATDYRLTITYRLSDNFATNKDSASGNALRVRTRGSNNTNVYATFESNMNTLQKGEWLTSTVEVKPVLKVHAFHVIVYAVAGSYFDVKEFRIEENPLPEFPEYYEFNAKQPKDVTINADLYGREIDAVWFWNEDQYEITDKYPLGIDDPNKVREDLTSDDYSIDYDTDKITISKDYLAKMSNGQKSIIFEIDGIQYAVIINILHSDIVPTPVVAGANSSGCGAVIGTTGAILSSLLLAGAVVVLKKKD